VLLIPDLVLKNGAYLSDFDVTNYVKLLEPKRLNYFNQKNVNAK